MGTTVEEIEAQMRQLAEHKLAIERAAREERRQAEEARQLSAEAKARALVDRINAVEVERAALLGQLYDELVSIPGPTEVRFASSEVWGSNTLRLDPDPRGREFQREQVLGKMRGGVTALTVDAGQGSPGRAPCP